MRHTLFQPAAQSHRHWRQRQVKLHTLNIILLSIALLPIYMMVVISFKNPLQFNQSRWAVTFPLRLGNYSAAWEIIHPYVVNTIFVALVGLAGVLLMSLIGGHVFSRLRFPFRNILYAAVIVLLTVPWVLSFIPSYMLFDSLKLIDTPWVLIIPNLANGPVFGIFLLRSTIDGIPEELYEASRCDGAGILTEIFRISLPLSLPALASLAVVNFVGTWNWFLWPLVTITSRENQLISVGLFRLSTGTVGFFGGGLSPEAVGPLFAGYVIAALPLILLFLFLGRFYIEGLTQSGLKV